jgi:hypothetical protein
VLDHVCFPQIESKTKPSPFYNRLVWSEICAILTA